jgi:hypothetical protein
MEQRIYFDDGKLVVETNNGRIKDGNTTTQISGEFIANADTVAMLLSELEGHSLTMQYIPCWNWSTRGTGHWNLITDKEIAEELKEAIESRDKVRSELDTLNRKGYMLKDVLDRINEHNKKWWRFWERKIDISDIVELYGTRLLED